MYTHPLMFDMVYLFFQTDTEFSSYWSRCVWVIRVTDGVIYDVKGILNYCYMLRIIKIKNSLIKNKIEKKLQPILFSDIHYIELSTFTSNVQRNNVQQLIIILWHWFITSGQNNLRPTRIKIGRLILLRVIGSPNP